MSTEKSHITDDILHRQYSDSSTADMQRLVQDCTVGIQRIDLKVLQTQQGEEERRVAWPSDARYGLNETQNLGVVWEEEAKL
jgi:hypothetical protein